MLRWCLRPWRLVSLGVGSCWLQSAHRLFAACRRPWRSSGPVCPLRNHERESRSVRSTCDDRTERPRLRVRWSASGHRRTRRGEPTCRGVFQARRRYAASRAAPSQAAPRASAGRTTCGTPADYRWTTRSRRSAGTTKRRSHAPSLDARRLPRPRTSVCAACTLSASALVARWMLRNAEHVELHRCRARSQDVIARHKLKLCSMRYQRLRNSGKAGSAESRIDEAIIAQNRMLAGSGQEECSGCKRILPTACFYRDARS
jgi:hypothetical protein